MTTINDFPARVLLQDTGERRYPMEGEIYFWFSRWNNEMNGPFIINDDSDEGAWASESTCFAIYKVIDPDMAVDAGL